MGASMIADHPQLEEWQVELYRKAKEHHSKGGLSTSNESNKVERLKDPIEAREAVLRKPISLSVD